MFSLRFFLFRLQFGMFSTIFVHVHIHVLLSYIQFGIPSTFFAKPLAPSGFMEPRHRLSGKRSTRGGNQQRAYARGKQGLSSLTKSHRSLGLSRYRCRSLSISRTVRKRRLHTTDWGKSTSVRSLPAAFSPAFGSPRCSTREA